MEESRYTKEELKRSEKFKRFIDAIEALLDEKKDYTVCETEDIIVNYMKGSV